MQWWPLFLWTYLLNPTCFAHDNIGLLGLDTWRIRIFDLVEGGRYIVISASFRNVISLLDNLTDPPNSLSRPWNKWRTSVFFCSILPRKSRCVCLFKSTMWTVVTCEFLLDTITGSVSPPYLITLTYREAWGNIFSMTIILWRFYEQNTPIQTAQP